MSNPWSDIEVYNRRTEALAERLELRIHALAWVLTAIVLAMRLIAGRQDLISDESWDAPSVELPAAETPSAGI
jgi:hypothetical protein